MISKEDWFNIFYDCGYKVFDIFGNDFTIEEWSNLKIPNYFIAAARDEDLEFIKKKLKFKISFIYELFSRKTFTIHNKIFLKFLRFLYISSKKFFYFIRTQIK